MTEIRVKLLGNVTFEDRRKFFRDFQYDALLDPMGIPYIPLAEILQDTIASLPNVRIGFAHPDGYIRLLQEVHELESIHSEIAPLVRTYFTEEGYCAQKDCPVRFLKAGLIFSAYVEAESDEERKILEQALKKCTHIGIQTEGISGEVSCSLLSKKEISEPQFSDNITYARLEYIAMPIVPTCFDTPYADGAKTFTYIPGSAIKNAVKKNISPKAKDMLNTMRFAHAYISDGIERLLPLPLCMSLVKLDKTQLHYRLAGGKDPSRTEQDVRLGDAYARDFTSIFTSYTKPETKRIVSREGRVYDAICQGQMFKGTIYGGNTELRALAEYFSTHPHIFLGHLTQEGYGETVISVMHLHAKKISSECLARTFDVACLSHTIILNDEGMQDTSTEAFLAEVERALGTPGALRVAERYTDVYKDSSLTSGDIQNAGEVRCLAKGSIMRLETKNGSPIDISPILHTFIGERTKTGYGEIMAFPAKEGYYRAAEQVAPAMYSMNIPITHRMLSQASLLTNNVIRLILKKHVQSLAVADRQDSIQSAASSVPLELLQAIRERYDTSVTDEELSQWYQEGLEAT